MSFLRTVLYIGLLVSVPLRAVDFQRNVRPVLAAHCFKCHGPDEKTRKAKLRLDIRPELDLLDEILSRIDHSDSDELMPPPAAKKNRSSCCCGQNSWHPLATILSAKIAEGGIFRLCLSPQLHYFSNF